MSFNCQDEGAHTVPKKKFKFPKVNGILFICVITVSLWAAYTVYGGGPIETTEASEGESFCTTDTKDQCSADELIDLNDRLTDKLAEQEDVIIRAEQALTSAKANKENIVKEKEAIKEILNSKLN